MILADVGEIGIYYKGREIILRPSLYAMSRIADKKTIVEIFSYVMNGDHAYSLLVIQACTNEDISDIYGMYELVGDELLFYDGEVSKEETIIIAQSLLKHGLIGDVERKQEAKTTKNYTPEFDAKSYVSAVVAHLGISEREAWNMTMTSIAGALQAKFPPIEDAKYLSEERENEIMEAFYKERNKKNGSR